MYFKLKSGCQRKQYSDSFKVVRGTIAAYTSVNWILTAKAAASSCAWCCRSSCITTRIWCMARWICCFGISASDRRFCRPLNRSAAHVFGISYVNLFGILILSHSFSV